MKTENKKQDERTFTNSMKASRWWGLLVFVILVIVDQLTKIIADVYFNLKVPPYYTSIRIIPGVLELGPMSYNRGFAFSFLAGGQPIIKFLMVWASFILMGVLGYVYYKTDKNRTWFRWALIFIIAGGVANFIDRANYYVWAGQEYEWIVDGQHFRDGVRDFIYVKLIFDFGFCNLADFFIVGGCIALILAMLFFDSYALYPHGKYEKLAVETARRNNEKKRIKYNKKYGKYIDEANKK